MLGRRGSKVQCDQHRETLCREKSVTEGGTAGKVREGFLCKRPSNRLILKGELILGL